MHVKRRLLELRLKLHGFITTKYRRQWGGEKGDGEKEGKGGDTLYLQNCKMENRNKKIAVKNQLF